MYILLPTRMGKCNKLKYKRNRKLNLNWNKLDTDIRLQILQEKQHTTHNSTMEHEKKYF